MSSLIKNRYWVLAAVLTVFYILTGFFYYQYIATHDYWAYSASIKELSRHMASPSHPFISAHVPCFWFSPYVFLLALFQKLGGIDIFVVLNSAGIANLVILILGLYFFIKEYFSDGKFAFPVLLTMLFFWGRGWTWSGFFDLDILRNTLPYPYVLCFGLSLFCFFSAMKYLKNGRAIHLVFIVLASCFILLTHIITSSFCYLSLALFAIDRRDATSGRRALILATIPASLLLAALWPYYPFYKAILLSGSLKSIFSPDSHEQLISSLGPILVAIPVIAYYLVRKKYLFMIAWFLVCAAVYLVSFLTNDPITQRYLFYAAFLMAIFISLAVRDSYRCLNSDKSLFPRIVVCTYVFLLIAGIAYQGTKVARGYKGYVSLAKLLHNDPGVADNINGEFLQKYSFLKNIVKDGDVVMSDTVTSWITPSFSGKTVSIWPHYDPFVTDGAQRYAETVAFFEEGAGSVSRRVLLYKYGVSYILIDHELVAGAVSRALGDLGRAVYEDAGFTLIKVGPR